MNGILMGKSTVALFYPRRTLKTPYNIIPHEVKSLVGVLVFLCVSLSLPCPSKVMNKVLSHSFIFS